MIEHRSDTHARLEDGVREGSVGGSALLLVTVCLSDDGLEVSDALGEPVNRLPVVSYLCPSEARALAVELLELAELAERRSEEHE